MESDLALSFRLLIWLLLPFSIVAMAEDNTQTAHETVMFFESEAIPQLKLVISSESQQQLRETPREYASCSLVENGTPVFKSIGLKLKGAAGSYRDFDDRPGLTLNIDKYKKSQLFHGMEKFHLNNAVQDESLLNEWLGSEVFRAAGIQAPRVMHVRLWMNDRDMGVYILREGFDRPFLKRAFGDHEGNLYDGGFVQDIDSELEMDMGIDRDHRMDLVGLAAACYHPAPAKRWESIAQRLDMDRFTSFMALERICGHWDGYTLNMNNYRIYFPRESKGIFLPHGMDQLFGDPNAGLYDHSNSLLSAAVMQNDPWREMYREQLRKLAALLQPVESWINKIDRQQERLKLVLESIDEGLANFHRDRINELKERFMQRAKALPELIENGLLQPMKFDNHGTVQLDEWYPSVEAEEMKLEEVDLAGVASYSITRERFGDFASSWRRRVLLPKGKFRFEARMMTKEVIPIPDEQGHGAGIRLSRMGRSNEMVGTNDWTLVTYQIEVLEDQHELELVLELRARYGTVWIDRRSLKIRRDGE